MNDRLPVKPEFIHRKKISARDKKDARDRTPKRPASNRRDRGVRQKKARHRLSQANMRPLRVSATPPPPAGRPPLRPWAERRTFLMRLGPRRNSRHRRSPCPWGLQAGTCWLKPNPEVRSNPDRNYPTCPAAIPSRLSCGAQAGYPICRVLVGGE